MKLGVDMNGVVRRHRKEGSDSQPEMAGSFGGLKQLNEGTFAGKLYLLVKVGAMPEKKMRWLEDHDFFRRTDIQHACIYFYSSREEKLALAADLDLTDFVDDNPELLRELPSTVSRRLLFRPQDRNSGFIEVSNWVEVVGTLTGRKLLSGGFTFAKR